MTIKANKSNHPYLMVSIDTLLSMLHLLPVDITINRLYVTDHNDVVSFNFTYNKIKYLLTHNRTNPDAHEYYISSNKKNTKQSLIIDDTLIDQIMNYIK